MMISEGTVINDRYEVAGKVADGGMGQLYIVRDLQLNGVTRALKLLKSQHGSPSVQQSIQREAYLLMRLQHRCLPQLFDYHICEATHTAFIVMEWIDGVHLGQWLKQYSKSLNLSFIYFVAIEIADALCYLHAQQPAIIHRDLKPSNIMLSKDGAIKLIDFGISKQIHAEPQHTIAFGTKGYAAPEQLLGKGTDERSDIYSFGAVLLTLLGIDPITVYGSNNGAATLRQRFLALANTMRFAVPKALRELIIDCMQEEPQHRPQSATELKARLREITREDRSNLESIDRSIAETHIKQQLSRSDHNRGKIIAVIGAHGGAGSTMVALALANWYKLRHTPTTFIEHRHNGAELFYSLQASSNGLELNDERSFQHALEQDELHQLQGGVLSVTAEEGNYFLCNPLHRLTVEQRFELTIQLAQQSALQRDVMIDYSANWETSHINAIVQHADYIVIVNSPWIITQAPAQMNKLSPLLQAANKCRVKVVWISNRDQSFRGRKSWLELHGGLEHIIIPEINSKVVLDNLWGKASFPPYYATIKTLQKYLMPLMKKVINLQ